MFYCSFKFVTAAQEICESFKDDGYWADFIDPSSGRPVSCVNNYPEMSVIY